MALINCPDCSQSVSDQAPACINCGRPLTAQSVASTSVATPNVGSQEVRDDIQAKYDGMYPNEPVLAAQKAHDERVDLANRLQLEGGYTAGEYEAFVQASEADLQRDIAARSVLRPWDWGRIANFRSRTRRIELLAAMAIAWLTFFAAVTIDAVLWEYPVFTILSLGVWLWLYVGASVNRFHDMGYIGWTVLWAVVPFASFVILVLALFVRGDSQPNRWGPPVA